MTHKKNYKKLISCIFFDLIGMLSIIIPVFDIIWAPIAAGILLKMFGMGTKGKLATIIGFLEEILPFTDVFPTFTVFWIYENFFERKSTKLLKK